MMRTRLCLFTICCVVIASLVYWLNKPVVPIRIGVIISQTGPLAVSAKPMLHAAELAVAEINRQGGLLERPIEIIAVDGRSDNQVFAQEATRLIEQEKVSALFACWTSACRKTLLPIVESHNHLLFYPVQYEGAEQSPNIIYTGAIPNQQIIPALAWASKNLGQHIYLVGSDYIYSHMIHHIIEELAIGFHVEVVGEHYLPLASNDASVVIEEIKRLQPTLIINTTNGIANQVLFDTLQKHGLGNTPILSTSITEESLAAMPALRTHPTHYVAASYFQSLPDENNQRFIKTLTQLANEPIHTSAPVVSLYNSIKLWANAVKDSQTDKPQDVNRAIIRQSVGSATGPFAIDLQTRHVWLPLLIGKAQTNGQFEIVYRSKENIKPVPFPDYQTKAEWLQETQFLGKEQP